MVWPFFQSFIQIGASWSSFISWKASSVKISVEIDVKRAADRKNDIPFCPTKLNRRRMNQRNSERDEIEASP